MTTNSKTNKATHVIVGIGASAGGLQALNDFFDNVIVNDEDIIIKKNRLELLNMLCKTFDNYFNFSKINA